MPFANCQTCGRLFHHFDPNLPESVDDYWPNLNRGDALHELCPECLNLHNVRQRNAELNPDSIDVRTPGFFG